MPTADAASPRPRALIASGAGRYGDPWHPFAATSARLADVLAGAGFDASVDDDLDGAMTRLADVDLLVVNAGDPWRDGATRGSPAAARGGLRDALARGMGVLAVHSAVSSLRDYPEWPAAVGAVWLPGVSMHPEIGRARITAQRGGEVEMPDFEVFDERYCRLQRIGESVVVATHAGADAGEIEPTAWIRDAGRARVGVSVLGHDERAYDSAGNVALVTALARWAARA